MPWETLLKQQVFPRCKHIPLVRPLQEMRYPPSSSQSIIHYLNANAYNQKAGVLFRILYSHICVDSDWQSTMLKTIISSSYQTSYIHQKPHKTGKDISHSYNIRYYSCEAHWNQKFLGKTDHLLINRKWLWPFKPSPTSRLDLTFWQIHLKSSRRKISPLWKRKRLNILEVIWKSDEEPTDIEYALNKFQQTNFYEIKCNQ